MTNVTASTKTRAARPSKGSASKAPVAQSAPAVKPIPAQAPIEVARANVQAKVASGVGVTLHTNGSVIKGLSAEPLLIKPTRKHAQKIGSIKGHPGKGNCVKRFHLYQEGMTMLHCKTTEGLIWSDVTFYAQNGYLTIVEGTDAEYADMVKAYEAKTKTAEVSAQAA